VHIFRPPPFLMRSLFIALVISLLAAERALAYGALACTSRESGWDCTISYNEPTPEDADTAAMALCSRKHRDCSVVVPAKFHNQCLAAAAGPNSKLVNIDFIPRNLDTDRLLDGCNRRDGNCRVLAVACDGNPFPYPVSISPPSYVSVAISAAVGVLLILLAYTQRARLENWIIHGNLPHELPTYSEDIVVLFKRTQRVNWYGRVIFGIIVNLITTKAQLGLVRRYWLGRVIAFDSLRRERQNELARMHLQLAASVRTEAKEKTVASRLWAIVAYVILVIFYLFRALISFLFGFLFIRVNIAKLARGTTVESKDLVLILQAKEAIEETAVHLKEYLATAQTFDGSDEVYRAE
jgi:hypothetical protein